MKLPGPSLLASIEPGLMIYMMLLTVQPLPFLVGKLGHILMQRSSDVYIHTHVIEILFTK